MRLCTRVLQLSGNEDVQLLILAGWGFAYPNKAFQGQVCWEVRWWVSVCPSGWIDGWMGGRAVLCFVFAFGQIQTICGNKN